MALRKEHAPDKPFLVISGILLFFGLFVLASASVAIAQREFGNAFYYVVRQLSFGVSVGIIGALGIQFMPMKWIRSLAIPAFVATILLLLIVFIPGIGVGTQGAVRWIQLGPVTVQPGEIARVTLPWYLAAWFVSRNLVKGKQEEIILPFLAIIALIGIPLILQPDLSTFGVLALTALTLYFLAGGSLKSIAAFVAAGLVSLLVLIRIAPYRMNRVISFLDPQVDPLGIGYQVNQSLLAVGSGGVFGRGLGLSREKLFFLPEPMGDTIFAVFAEEMGFVGAVALIFLFVLFLWRGFFIVRRLADPFLRLFAAGLVTWIVLQAFLNISGNVALTPLVGITLPFISYGSSSLVVTLISVGFLYKFSRYTKLSG